MKIYTKTGDSGETSLFGGLRVQKNHPRIQLYGELDSLNSHIGYLVALSLNCPKENSLTSVIALLKKVQDEIFVFGSHFATENESSKSRLPTPNHSLVLDLEASIDELELKLSPLQNFILPGGSLAASYAHITRTHSRLVERIAIEFIVEGKFSESEQAILNQFIVFINRLSDFFFVVSRYLNKIAQTPDEVWKR